MKMLNQLLQKKRLRKRALHSLRNALFARNMREDIAAVTDLEELEKACSDVRWSLDNKEYQSLTGRIDRLDLAVEKVCPCTHKGVVTEMVEIVVVALGVAMACRSYLIQPFKIPTGSMQPTLYGIHFDPTDGRRLSDKYPLNIAKWFITGQWYKEVPAKSSGVVKYRPRDSVDNGVVTGLQGLLLDAGDVRYAIPTGMKLRVSEGKTIKKGDIIACGMKTAGDHVFVDRASWNFRQPRKSEVMVFLTSNIELMDDSNRGKFYIKRMTGVPGEKISISDPAILANRIPETRFKIGSIASNALMNGGYHLAMPAPAYPRPVLMYETDFRDLTKDEFFAMGDNTLSSLDSRYWGPVPRKNLVGPACLVYWPFSERWGRITR